MISGRAATNRCTPRNRSAAHAPQTFERSNSIDHRREIELQAVGVTCDAEKTLSRCNGQQHGIQIAAGHRLQLPGCPAFFETRKSISIVVTGAPCNAAAALPISTASKPCLSRSCAMRARRGAASLDIERAAVIGSPARSQYNAVELLNPW